MPAATAHMCKTQALCKSVTLSFFYFHPQFHFTGWPSVHTSLYTHECKKERFSKQLLSLKRAMYLLFFLF